MKASQFLSRHDIGHTVTPADKPDYERGIPGHPWFLVRFFLPAQQDHLAVEMNYGGAVDDDVNTISDNIAEVFYRMAQAAYYGEGYELLVEDFGSNLHLTQEQWEQGQKALRERCRAWLTDDVMWEEFLAVEIDDDGTGA